MSQNLYKTDEFSIEYIPAADILKGDFLKCKTSGEYVRAIRAFKEVYERVLPRYTFWDNTKFRHIITPQEQKWTDSFLNYPGSQKGVTQKVGILVSQDVLAMLSVYEIFEQGKAPLRPGFFSHEEQALEWLAKKEDPVAPLPDHKPSIAIDWNKEKAKAVIRLEMDAQDLPYYMARFKRFLNEHDFLKKNLLLFQSLTKRERKILSMIIEGQHNGEIAEQLFISCETVKTHRKNIMRKLDCSGFRELVRFGLFL
ncbi:helix-turn-helix domain-containing protein [Niabella drilacis]|uniref:Regulatory protein, luxR family n=1 Tax=Niabella drilacis (strain DSM 25811 / CCM 8410 / CCUG 62505 / LMG 26954 / E90) TaxID=1285928 RepID=A0A1G6XAQ1_NIADE|nr:helix-turn-helix transcriptional regulator [Niabella drilacis]SDD75269.1 regulatory protein, luxR family [Niabella drilacis]